MKRLAIFALAVLTACTGNLGEGFKLYYPSLTEICPGTGLSLNPSWVGGAPGDFSVSGIRYEGETYATDCFSINAGTGVFVIEGSDNLPLGSYSIDISCSVDGKRYDFSNAIGITMMKSVPDGIKVTPSELEIKASDIHAGVEGLPGAVIEPDGEGYVQIKRFLIQNVYKDGELANQCKIWFSLDENTGEFSVKTGNPDFTPGTYTFDFKLTTYKVGASDEAGIYANALTLKAVSAPYNLVYNPAERKVEVNSPASSAVPSYLGTPQETVFSIIAVNPEGGPAVSVEPSTGVLTMQAPSEAQIGTDYVVSVRVANVWGAADFENAFTFRIISYIHPITKLNYANVGGIVSGRGFSNAPVDFDGDDLTFSLVDLPAELSKLTIDVSTGTVSNAEGVEITPGTYTVTVQAQNNKSSVRASFTLEIVPNPNHFTYVRWGNNLGLEPIADYGNQFRVYHGSGRSIFPIVESDIPEGRPVKYSLVRKTNSGSWGAQIRPNGEIWINAQAVGGTILVHFAHIVVQVGADDDENKVIRTFPLFIDQSGFQKNGYRIEYTPFAFHINPRKGGRGPAPTIVNAEGVPANQPTLDMRTNPWWYNLYGPAEHKEGRINTDPTTFLKCVWDKYYTALGTLPNYGACNPISWWYNYEKGNLSITGAYIDGETLQVVVNPDRFVDDYGYADGAMGVICRFSTDGKNPQTGTSGVDSFEVSPFFIWLDPNYNQ